MAGFLRSSGQSAPRLSAGFFLQIFFVFLADRLPAGLCNTALCSRLSAGFLWWSFVFPAVGRFLYPSSEQCALGPHTGLHTTQIPPPPTPWFISVTVGVVFR